MSRGGDANDTVRDYSAYGRTGTFNTAQPTRGLIGGSKAGLFAGGTVNFYTTAFSEPLLDFTVTAWFYPSAASAWRRIADYKFDQGFWLGNRGNGAASWGGGVQNASDPYGLWLTGTVGAWNFLALQRIGSTAYLYYWDAASGWQSASGACGGAAMTTTNHVRIGNSDPGSVKVGDNWDGGIDEVRIYNRAIEFSTIQMLGSRRGIAYETKPRPLPRKLSAATFKSAWARNSNVLIGM